MESVYTSMYLHSTHNPNLNFSQYATIFPKRF